LHALLVIRHLTTSSKHDLALAKPHQRDSLKKGMTEDKWKSGLPRTCQRWLGGVATNLRKPHVWQPMLKNVLGAIITITIGVIPAVVKVYGTSTFLGAMTSIFGQPGQSFGKSKSPRKKPSVRVLKCHGSFSPKGIGYSHFHVQCVNY
jgi:hypothetical protein